MALCVSARRRPTVEMVTVFLVHIPVVCAIDAMYLVFSYGDRGSVDLI